ncbi:hypothetical protein HPP92_006769 [Vanilla planifolia]|uniref:Uncharacterized protein n=1 Tax=Vanilla planifolia TaxID=51239 RepID=A0A835V811_VANPL|nr:hypothetical protein HPP92_006769 [Vanilla planifolia]
MIQEHPHNKITDSIITAQWGITTAQAMQKASITTAQAMQKASRSTQGFLIQFQQKRAWPKFEFQKSHL